MVGKPRELDERQQAAVDRAARAEAKAARGRERVEVAVAERNEAMAEAARLGVADRELMRATGLALSHVQRITEPYKTR